jgi:hypothetical protein
MVIGMGQLMTSVGGAGTVVDGPEYGGQCIRRVAQMRRADVPDDLFQVGLATCGCDAHARFETGVDLIATGRPSEGRRR